MVLSPGHIPAVSDPALGRTGSHALLSPNPSPPWGPRGSSPCPEHPGCRLQSVGTARSRRAQCSPAVTEGLVSLAAPIPRHSASQHQFRKKRRKKKIPPLFSPTFLLPVAKSHGVAQQNGKTSTERPGVCFLRPAQPRVLSLPRHRAGAASFGLQHLLQNARVRLGTSSKSPGAVPVPVPVPSAPVQGEEGRPQLEHLLATSPRRRSPAMGKRLSSKKTNTKQNVYVQQEGKKKTKQQFFPSERLQDTCNRDRARDRATNNGASTRCHLGLFRGSGRSPAPRTASRLFGGMDEPSQPQT